MLYETPLPERFALPITRVTRVQQPGTLAPGGETFDLLAVDSATLASAAYWNPSFSDPSIQEIAHRLAGPAGDRIPIVVAGSGTATPGAMDFAGRDIPVQIVARARAFPGMTSLRPLVVVDADTLLEAFAGAPNPLQYSPGASTEFWVKGDPDRASVALRALKYSPYLILTADQVKDIPEIAAAIGSFLVLNGLGLIAALLVVLGMLMYLQARQRSQVVSYGLSLRMGMSHSAHRRSLTAELGAMLCFSYAIGLPRRGISDLAAARSAGNDPPRPSVRHATASDGIRICRSAGSLMDRRMAHQPESGRRQPGRGHACCGLNERPCSVRTSSRSTAPQHRPSTRSGASQLGSRKRLSPPLPAHREAGNHRSSD